MGLGECGFNGVDLNQEAIVIFIALYFIPLLCLCQVRSQNLTLHWLLKFTEREAVNECYKDIINNIIF